MNCWICGNKGDSGEHLIKASDIKGMFSDISQSNPIYQNFEDNSRFPMGSAKSDRLKSKALICKYCNNNRTAPHDKSWAKLSEYLRKLPLHKRGPLKVWLAKAFAKERYQNVLNVHLYFVKLFGCRIVEETVPIDIESFSKAIMTGKANPNVFLLFKKWNLQGSSKSAILTSIQSINDKNKCISASWMYTVGNLIVEIFYTPVKPPDPIFKYSLHPTFIDRMINFIDLDLTYDKLKKI